MTGFLVTIACIMDNVPVRLFERAKDANAFAKSLDVNQELEAAFGPTSDPVHVSVVRFNKAGRPISEKVIRELT